MELGHEAALTALPLTAGATAAVAVPGSNPLAPASDRPTDVRRAGAIDLLVDGTLQPGDAVTVTARHDGASVACATVAVNGEVVGRTDANGTRPVAVPDAGELEIEVVAGDRETELSVEFEERHERGDED